MSGDEQRGAKTVAICYFERCERKRAVLDDPASSRAASLAADSRLFRDFSCNVMTEPFGPSLRGADLRLYVPIKRPNRSV